MMRGDLPNGHRTPVRIKRSNKFMRHYYEYTLRLFNDGRPDDYVKDLFLSAAKNGDYERVQNFLVRTSRNLSVNVDAKDQNGFTAIMHAALNEHRKVVSLLLNYGADITLWNNRGQSVLDFAPDSMKQLLLGSVARQGYSSRHLLQASWQGNLELVKKLLSSKSKSGILDVNCKNADGLTPLLLVTRDLNLFQKIETAVLENGYSPAEVVRELLQHDADCGAKDSEGKRPLHFAAHGKGSHAKDVVDVLIEEAGSHIDSPDSLSNSPLHWATKKDNQPILLALIKGGANVNARGHIGKTPLHIAASHGYEETSDTLLKHGADVTIVDDNGQSPMDVAKGRRVQIVLKDAWVTQTKHNIPRQIFSVSPDPAVDQDPARTASIYLTEPKAIELDLHISQNSATPMQRSEGLLKKRQNLLDVESSEDIRTSTAPTKRGSDAGIMPRILSGAKAELNRGFKNSSMKYREKCGQKQSAPRVRDAMKSVVLPSLSILNVELKDIRNLRGGKQEMQIKRRTSYLGLPSQHRLQYRLSSPVITYQRKISPPLTPDKDSRVRSSSMSQIPKPLPSRVPPLPTKGVITPELRSVPSPDVIQERLPVTTTIVDLDMLRREGLQKEMLPPLSPVFSSELTKDTSSLSSPRRESRRSGTSQKEEKHDVPLTSPSDTLDMTRTFTSIQRPSFWIPADDDMEVNEKSSDTMKTETSSNGTAFYIDLKDLEALATGNCSSCKKPLPEGSPAGKLDSAVTCNSEKELCKSCRPRAGSNEEVFWIPFGDEQEEPDKQLKSKVESKDDNSRTNTFGKSLDNNLENCKLPRTRDTSSVIQEELKPSVVIATAENGDEAHVTVINSSELSTPSPTHLASFPSNITGFDVSCFCDIETGLCSCTISKKQFNSSPPMLDHDGKVETKSTNALDTVVRNGTKSMAVVKTVGEASSVRESTFAARTEENYSVPPSGESRTNKDTEIVLKSFTETDIPRLAVEGDESVRESSTCDEERKESNRKEGFARSEVQQGTLLPPTPEPLNDSSDTSPPMRAWSTPTPRPEETDTGSIRIVNPFPSPEPPEDKSAVHSPIGPSSESKSRNKKATSGKKGKKGKSKSSGSTKSTKPKPITKDQEQNGKSEKKKSKGKRKSEMKMITVQQREADDDLGLRTMSQESFEMPEDVPVPPTLTMDSSAARALSTRMLKGKVPVLSPIPESPRSKASTPGVTVALEDVRENAQVQGTNADAVVAAEEPRTGGDENSVGIMPEEDYDVVDGWISDTVRALGSCFPGFSGRNKDSRCDAGSDSEQKQPLIEPPLGDTLGNNPKADPENGEDMYERDAQDEADDVLEDLVQRGLSLRDKESVTRSDQVFVGDFVPNGTRHASPTREHSLEYCHFSRDPESDLSESEAEERSLDYRTSSERSSDYSDTDSSYNSGGSESPHPFSSVSSLNSSDTYISSPRYSSCPVTPTQEGGTCSGNSVERDYYERMAREKSIASRGNSSDSSRTLTRSTPRSNGSLGSISQGPMGSLGSEMSENLVHSRLSASSRTPSSTSHDEEIVWKKGNLLGKGAFGTVWCGLTDKGEMIAVKQVELNHSNWDEAEKQYEKLQEEVDLLKSLQHPNIVQFIGTCLDGGVVNIFMEFVAGGSIASVVARFGCLDEPVFRRYTKQLLSGVSYLHSNNVIHRDIKGGNILINASGVLKLIDFGCAKRLYMNLSMSKSNILRSMKGTPYWMAPEVIRETGHGRKSDIWSVGCTVFEMATGKPPWSDMPPMAAIFAIGSGSLTIPKLSDEFSESARDFVCKCLIRDPGFRPSADDLLRHDFIGDLA